MHLALHALHTASLVSIPQKWKIARPFKPVCSVAACDASDVDDDE